MFELAENTASLNQVSQYELVLSHCLEKLGVNDSKIMARRIITN